MNNVCLMNRWSRVLRNKMLLTGLAASVALISASNANALQDSHEAGITYSGNWSTVTNPSAIGGSYVRASMAIEDSTSSLKFIPSQSNWTIVQSSAASGGSYLSAPNDGAPVVLVEDTGTTTDGLSYSDGNQAWWQGASMKVSSGIANKVEDRASSVIYRYNSITCSSEGVATGTDICNGGFGVGDSTTYCKKNLPTDHDTSIEVPFTGSNVTAVFSIGTSRGKVDIEVRKASDNTLVRSTTGFDTSTTSKAAFGGLGQGNYKLIIKGTGLQGAATPQGYAYYFHYAQVYPSIEYQFFGPSIIYEGHKNVDYGLVNLYIDGQQEDGDLNTAGTQPFDLYSATPLYTTIFSNTKDGSVSKTLGYSNGGNKHRILVESTGEKNAASTGWKLALDKFRALPSISGTISTGGSLNIATLADSNLGTWKFFVDGKTDFSVDNNSPSSDKELNTYFNGGPTLRNFRVTGLNAGSREFSFVSKRDPVNAPNKVTFDGIANATAEHTFTGTMISYVARKGPDQGRVKVFIDGVEQDADSVTPNVQPFDLYAATEQLKQVVFTTSSLTNASHTIRIEQEGTKHASSTGTGINLDAFQSKLAIDQTFDIATAGGTHMLPFTIGSTQYIAISNHVDFTPSTGLSYSLPDAEVYKFDPSTGFELVATLPTVGASGLEHFVIGSDHYLAVANYRSSAYAPTDYIKAAQIYKWYPSQNNGKGGFDSDVSDAQTSPLQAIETKGGIDVEFFEEGGERYLAIANNTTGGNPGTFNVDTRIYKWNAASGNFDTNAMQIIPSFGASRVVHFRIDGALYFGIANGRKSSNVAGSTSSTTSTNSVIYKWGATANGGTPGFAGHQSIWTVGATDMEFFTIDGVKYLAIGSSGGNSMVYRWDSSTAQFDTTNSVQTLPGAADLEYFQYGAHHYLAGAADVYKWTGTKFEIELTPLPNISQGQRVEHFFLGNSLYLTVPNFYLPKWTNGFFTPDYSVDSKVFRLE